MPSTAKSRQVAQAALRWFGGATAARLLLAEQSELIPALTGVHGRHALYLRPAAAGNRTLSGHLLGDVLNLHACADGSWCGDICCGRDGFPLADDSLALVYLLHTLDHCLYPEYLLREAARLLQPDGCLISVGLNPWSLWSWRWRGRGLQARTQGKTGRLIEGAGLTLLRRFQLGPVSPFDLADLPRAPGQRTSFTSGLRAGYAWCARKRVQTLTPDVSAARRRARLVGGRTEAAPNAG